MPKRLAIVALGFVLGVVTTSCSASRSGDAEMPCDDSSAAKLLYPQPDARRVATSLSEVIVSRADRSRTGKISLIDAGGQQRSLGALKPVVRFANDPDGAGYEAASVTSLAPEMNYIVLYSTVACAGEADYAIGSFTTE